MKNRLTMHKKLYDQLRNQFGYHLTGQLGAQFEAQLGYELRDHNL